MAKIVLAGREITPASPPYVIAEIGVNHEGSMDLAKELVRLAKAGGAHAAKFQTYKAETLTIRHSPAYWDLTKEPTRSQFELFKKYDRFGEPEYEALAAYCREVGIDFASTPFDRRAVDFLDPLMAYFKVASADLTNIPLLRQVGRKGKPVVLSTGCATPEEINLALDTLRQAGSGDIALLHCVLSYPTPNPDAHLGVIRWLRQYYPDCVTGYSDHTVPDDAMTSLCTAYLLGAVVLEKHFTHDKSLPGNDHYHAMDTHDLAVFTRRAAAIRELVGGSSDTKAQIQAERGAIEHARRSIVSSRKIVAGEIFTEDNLTTKRPAHGLAPIHWDKIVGKRCAKDIEADALLTWEHVGQ